jgi:hypothetical protein
MVSKIAACDGRTHQTASTTLLQQSQIKKPDEVQDLSKEFSSSASTVVDMDDAASASTSSSVGTLKQRTYDIDELASQQGRRSHSDRVKAWNAKRDRIEELSKAALAKDFTNLAGVSHYSCMGLLGNGDDEIIMPEDSVLQQVVHDGELQQEESQT